MGLRFRKSMKIAPGLKLNLSKKSVGITAGTKGIHASINTSGRKTNTVGIPGTGLSYTSIKWGKRKMNSTTTNQSNGNKNGGGCLMTDVTPIS